MILHLSLLLAAPLISQHLTLLPDEIDIEIFDLLMSLGDFSEFKQLMLAHKKEKTSRSLGGAEPLTVFGTNLTSTSNSKVNKSVT